MQVVSCDFSAQKAPWSHQTRGLLPGLGFLSPRPASHPALQPHAAPEALQACALPRLWRTGPFHGITPPPSSLPTLFFFRASIPGMPHSDLLPGLLPCQSIGCWGNSSALLPAFLSHWEHFLAHHRCQMRTGSTGPPPLGRPFEGLWLTRISQCLAPRSIKGK